MKDLSTRFLEFSINTINAIKKYPNSMEYYIIKKQLLRSVTSIGANYEEAQGSSTNADFHHKTRIALKEARETNYWLKLISAISPSNLVKNKIQQLIIESEEIKRILGSIAVKSDPRFNGIKQNR